VKRLLRDRVALAAMIALVVIALASVLAPLIAPQNPYDPAALDILDAEIPPFWQAGSDGRFILGTEAQGRDMLSALLYGAGVSLLIGLMAVAIQALLGLALGLVAGYAGGRADALLMRLADIQLSLSTLMVAIIALALVQAAFGAERFGALAVPMLALVIGLAEWPHFARTARGSVLAEKQKPYVLAAQALGQTPYKTVTRHILPNIASPLLVVATVQVANAILAEAALSFLGLGMPVTQPSLGALIRAGFELLLAGSWWITLLPAALLVVMILAINLIGDGLRDVLNPRLDAERRQ
jgi:peptide/nickel transport system permease protein